MNYLRESMSGAPLPPQPTPSAGNAAPPLEVPTYSLDLAWDVQCWATGWGTALRRATKVDVQAISVKSETPKVVSVRIGRTPIPVRSYTFPELPGWTQPQRGTSAPPQVPAATASSEGPGRNAVSSTP